MSLRNFVIIAVAIGLIGGVAYVLTRPQQAPLGATPGPEATDLRSFLSGFTTGGQPCLATSTTASVGTLSGPANGVTCIDYTVNQADVTLTTMASTSTWLPSRVNEVRSLWIRNASTTATADITIAAGTGMNLKSGTTTRIIKGDTGADNYARLDFIRQADSDVNVIFTPYTD